MAIEPEDDDAFNKINRSSRIPTVVGRPVVNQLTVNNCTNDSTTNSSYFKFIERRYLSPLLNGQERQKVMIKSLYINQIKIRKALSKTQVPIYDICMEELSSYILY